MLTLNLVKITDTSGKNTGEIGKITYQALTEKELDNILDYEGSASYIGYDFKVEMLDNIQIPSIKFNEEKEEWEYSP